MLLKKKSKLIIFSIPFGLALIIFYALNFKSDNAYIDDIIEIDETNSKDLEINNFNKPTDNFSLKKFGPLNQNTIGSIQALTRNPFKDLESTKESGLNLPNNIRFTGIAQVGMKKGVMVSTSMGIDIFYVGEQVSDGFKIVFIDTNNAEITLSNGINKTLVKLEQD